MEIESGCGTMDSKGQGVLGFLSSKGLQHLRMLVSGQGMGRWGWIHSGGHRGMSVSNCVCIAQSIFHCGNLGTERPLDLLGSHRAVSTLVSWTAGHAPRPCSLSEKGPCPSWVCWSGVRLGLGWGSPEQGQGQPCTPGTLRLCSHRVVLDVVLHLVETHRVAQGQVEPACTRGAPVHL